MRVRNFVLQVKDDGKFPCTVCPGCSFQLEATKSFFELIVEGQIRLRKLFAREQEVLRRERRQLVRKIVKIVAPNSALQTYSIQSEESGEKFLLQGAHVNRTLVPVKFARRFDNRNETTIK